MSLSDLEQECQVSARAIYRDLRVLSEGGVPLFLVRLTTNKKSHLEVTILYRLNDGSQGAFKVNPYFNLS